MERNDWELFKNISQGHHENRLAHADIKALKQALPHFTSLRKLIVTNRTPHETSGTGGPTFRMWYEAASKRSAAAVLPLAPRCDWMAPREGRSVTGTNTLTLDWLDDGFCQEMLPNGKPATIPEFLLPENSVGKEKNDDSVSVKDHWLRNELIVRRADSPYHHPLILSREARAIHLALCVLEDAKVCSQLKEFRVDPSTDMLDVLYDPGLPITLFSHQSPFPDRLASAFAISNLKRLWLTLGNKEYSNGGKDIMDQGYVTEVLASMPQLEQLHFEPHGMATVGALPPEMIYPRLRHVQFCCGEIDPDKLVNFARRHGSTLKKLYVTCCNISPGQGQDWQDVADQLNHLLREGVVNFAGSFSQIFIGETVVGCGCTNRYLETHYDSEEVDYKQVHSWQMKNGALTRKFKSWEPEYLENLDQY